MRNKRGRQMIIVTAQALERLSQKLERKRAPHDKAWRFRYSAGRWKLHLDRARPDDATFMHQQRKVLLLDLAAASAMDALTLTTRETDTGPRLRLRRTLTDED